METGKTAVEESAFYSIGPKKGQKGHAVERERSYCIGERENRTMSRLLEDFLEYARYELNFSPQTIIKYKDSLRCFMRAVGDKDVEALEAQDFVRFKRVMMERGAGEARIASVVYVMRSFLAYCQNFLGLKTLNPKQIRPPKRFRREVIYLTKAEIERFIATIDIKKQRGLRFVEVLLGTGMRIGEALSLNRKSINWDKREAKIIGNGNKERRVFFTERSFHWLRPSLGALPCFFHAFPDSDWFYYLRISGQGDSLMSLRN